MKKMTLSIDGKVYEKTEPVVRDWLVLVKKQLCAQSGTITAKDAVIQTVSTVLSIDKKALRNAVLKTNKIIKCYQTIIENIAECFHPDEKDAIKKYDLIISEQIEKGVILEAKHMYKAFGTLPENFFNQSLQDFLRINVVFTDAEVNGESNAHFIDETNF